MKYIKIMLFIPVIITTAFFDPYADRGGDGKSRYNDGKYQEAEKSYNEAEGYLPSKKDIPDLAFNKGDARFKLGDYDGAVEYYKQALGSQNKDVQKKALFNIGNAYVKKEDKSAAADAYMAALRIDPKYMNAKKNLELLYRKDNDKNKSKDDRKKEDKENNKKSNDKAQGQSGDQKKQSAMSKDQIKNMMQMMKDKPVLRQRKDDGKSIFGGNEKTW